MITSPIKDQNILMLEQIILISTIKKYKEMLKELTEKWHIITPGSREVGKKLRKKSLSRELKS